MAQATRRAMPILQVRDVGASRDVYVRLGCAPSGIWSDDATGDAQFCIVQRGDMTLALRLSRAPELVRNVSWAAYVYVDDVDALAQEFRGNGLALARDPEDVPYGCRDLDIRDPDGHLIAFGQDLHDDGHGPGLGPDRGAG